MRYATEILRTSADLFEARNKVYKDSTTAVGVIMAELVRSGRMRLQTPEDFRRFHILELKVVKLVRYCNNWNEHEVEIDGAKVLHVGHQDSIRDDIVYTAILESIDQEINESQVPF